MNRERSAEERVIIAHEAIRNAGYRVEYAPYCENADTPGLLGQIRGVTDHKRRLVRISTDANPSYESTIETLAHELHHVLDPSWDCGNRDVLGR